MDNQPIQSPPPPPSPSNSSKTFLFILGAILLMAVSAIVGYYLGANKDQIQTGGVAKKCEVCGPQGIHNIEGKDCALGLICKRGLTTSASYCVGANESVADCEK